MYSKYNAGPVRNSTTGHIKPILPARFKISKGSFFPTSSSLNSPAGSCLGIVKVINIASPTEIGIIKSMKNRQKQTKKNNVLRSIFVLVGFLALTGMASAQAVPPVFYVATNGSDSNSCSAAQNINTPKRTINNALSCLTAGSTLHLRGGTYNESLVGALPSGSSWSNAVTIASYPGEKATIKGYFYITGSQYFVIDNIIIDAAGFDADGIKLTYSSSNYSAHHIRVINSEIKNSPKQGVLITGQSIGELGYNEFINNNIHDNGTTDFDHGLYISSSNNLVQNSRIYRNSGWGVHIYSGGCSNCANNNVVRNNVVYNNARVGNRGTGILLGSGSGNVAYNNIVYGNKDGIWIQHGANNKAFNNTIYNTAGSGSYAVYIAPDAPGAVVQNNILYKNALNTVTNSGPSSIISNNLLGVDPRFVNEAGLDFHLQSNSPAINAGITVAVVTADYDGVTRPQGSAYDIGAYEYGGVIPPSTKFQIGNRVQTTANLNVRQTPSTSGLLLGTQATGQLGTVTGGPTAADGYNWWQIDYDNNPDGWSVEDFLVLATPPPLPVVSLSASPLSITSGQSSTLTWSSTNATSCTASGGWTGAKSTSGTQSVSPTINTAYTLTCTGSGGSASQSVTVAVTAAASGPVAHWKFDEGSGATANDSSGNGNTGTLTNGPTWVAGRIGGAISFDGVNDHVNVPDSNVLDVTSAFTLTAWVNPPSAYTDFRSVLIKNYVYYIYAYISGYCGAGNPMGGFTTGSSNVVCHAQALALNTWTSLAVSYDGSVLKFFRNGVEVASAPASGSLPPTTGSLQIAASQFGEYFRGLIDDVRVYNRALSSAEIQSIYTEGADTTPPTISSVAASSITTNSATVTWTTSENSDTQVEYGTTASYGTLTTLNAALVTSHSVALSGLSANTLYHYRVKSKDAALNLATSGDFTFTTTSPLPTVSLSASPLSITSGQSSTLTWSSTNATSCTASGGWTGAKSTSGTQSVSPTINTTYTLTCTGSGGSASQSVTVTVTAARQTIFTTQTPAGTASDANYEMGTRFTSTVNGQITAIRFYKATGETGAHTGRIWNAARTQLASVVFSGETASGWQEQALASPLSINANTEYMVSVNTGNRYYVYTYDGLLSQITNGNLRTIADGSNGRFTTTVGTYPASTFRNINYFRDIVFVPGAPLAFTQQLFIVATTTLNTIRDTLVAMQATLSSSTSTLTAEILDAFRVELSAIQAKLEFLKSLFLQQ